MRSSVQVSVGFPGLLLLSLLMILRFNANRARPGDFVETSAVIGLHCGSVQLRRCERHKKSGKKELYGKARQTVCHDDFPQWQHERGNTGAENCSAPKGFSGQANQD